MPEEAKRLESDQNAYLVINSQVFPIDHTIISIGRKLDNDLVIQDALVSREHAEIRYEGEQFVLYDLNSTGGTFVNNKKIERCILYSGDIICLATLPLMFINDAPSMESKAEQPTGQL